MLAVSALLALTLTSCATSGAKPTLLYPELPSDLRLCFDQTVAAPKAGPMSKAEVMRLVSKLKLSEAGKVECGKRLIAFYDSLSR